MGTFGTYHRGACGTAVAFRDDPNRFDLKLSRPLEVSLVPSRPHALLAVPGDGARDLYDALRQVGFRVTRAASGGDALGVLEAQASLPILVTETPLPALTALELIARFLERHPQGTAVLLAPEMDVTEHGDPRVVVLAGPVTPRAVAAVARLRLNEAAS